MKIKNVECLITKAELKQGKEGKAYILVDVLNLSDGTMFNILHRVVEDYSKFKPMTKFMIDFDLSSSKFGLSLNIDKIGEELGAI